MTRKLIGALGAVLMLVTAFATAASGAAVDNDAGRHDGVGRGHTQPRPVVFVHGGFGSGAQFETQALRLAGNGYPIDRIAVHEYDSTFVVNTTGDAEDRKDRVIYDSASGELFYDANGSKKGGSLLVATLDDALALDASHFLVV